MQARKGTRAGKERYKQARKCTKAGKERYKGRQGKVQRQAMKGTKAGKERYKVLSVKSISNKRNKANTRCIYIRGC